MQAIINWIRSEPVALAALVAALITLGVAFGLTWSEPQKAAVIAVADIVLALLARAQVTPTVKIAQPGVGG